MAIMRVHKNQNYTTMSNFHFKERKMSLKAKGLFSLMLSLPDDWDYSISGLCTLSKDGKDSVMSALNELESFGYLIRTRLVDEKGRFAGYDYDIYESPTEVRKAELKAAGITENPYAENPNTENPYAENPNTGKPNSENPPQLNTNTLKTNKSITDTLNTKKESKTASAASFDSIIAAYTNDTKTIELLGEWLKVRKAKRAAMTDKAIQLNIEKLDKLAEDSNMNVNTYLEGVIMRGWAAFYEIKNYSNQQTNKKYGSAGIEIKDSNADEDVLKDIFV